MSAQATPRLHGGPDAQGALPHDFSTTANALGPHPATLQAVRDADHQRYPDPHATELRARLAAWHGVSPTQVLLAASASEYIFRASAVAGGCGVHLPRHGFGDYRAAAQAHQRPLTDRLEQADLVWLADPGSPRGDSAPPPPALAHVRTLQAQRGGPAPLQVLDRACEPLRLDGQSDWQAQDLAAVHQLWSPNKALGLTGVRGAYAIAPPDCPWAARLADACPSWPLGAAGVALLTSWCAPDTQAWVRHSRSVLRGWKHRQVDTLQALGFRVEDSVTNFFLVGPPDRHTAAAVHQALRAAGVAWRPTDSFGLPGRWRVSVQSPTHQQAMCEALHALRR